MAGGLGELHRHAELIAPAAKRPDGNDWLARLPDLLAQPADCDLERRLPLDTADFSQDFEQLPGLEALVGCATQSRQQRGLLRCDAHRLR